MSRRPLHSIKTVPDMGVFLDFDEVICDQPKSFYRDVLLHVIHEVPSQYPEVTKFSERKAIERLGHNITAVNSEGLSAVQQWQREDAFKCLFGQYGDHVIQAAERIYWEYYVEHKPAAVRFVDGAKETLRWFEDNHIPYGIVTNASTLSGIEALLKQEFPNVLILYNANKPKEIAGVTAMEKYMRLTAGTKIFFVGDRVETDIELANKLGYTSILMIHQDTTGFRKTDGIDPERIKLQKPDHEVHNHEELRSLLAEQLRRIRYKNNGAMRTVGS